MKSPRFSVVIPALNEEKFLPRLLESLSVQTKRNFEVVVVDGKSKDKTVEVARAFEKKLPKLEVVISKKASLPLQRNIGAKSTSGEWLVFIDADSVLMPYFFERIEPYIDRKNPKVLTTWFQPDTDEVNYSMIALLGNMMLEGGIMFHRPLPPGPLSLVQRVAYDSIGGYDEEHAFSEDMDFGLRLYKAGIHLEIVKETLYIVSFRRLRNQGTGKVLQQYLRGTLPVLFLNKAVKFMPGYSMGGHLYNRKNRPIQRSVLREYEGKFRKLVSELFA